MMKLLTQQPDRGFWTVYNMCPKPECRRPSGSSCDAGVGKTCRAAVGNAGMRTGLYYPPTDEGISGHGMW